MTTNEELLVVLRRVAHELTSKRNIRDRQRTLSDIVTAAVDTIPHVEAGGVSMTEGGEVVSRDPTTESVTKLDRLQGDLDEGPCISAITEPPPDGIIVVADLAGTEGDRWPHFAPAAVEVGYRSMMSTSLSFTDESRAALNLYAGTPNIFDADARLIAGLFGVQAAMLLHGSEQAGFLQRAVDSRDLIGQAKGILMERFTVDDDAAFQMLVRSSQDTNMKVVDVARWLQDAAARRGRPSPRGEAEPGS